MSAAAVARPVTPRALPLSTRAAIFLRLLAVQGSWNYELLIGNGIAFSLEPALRRLPGGVDGVAFRQALAREARYFNAHPYLAAVAVGALARVELDECAPVQIERFRTALPGPLGSVGDRLVWAGWLPFCSLLALLAFALGASPPAILLIFLGTYNVGHLGLRVWGLHVGWRHGLRVATALGNPVLRKGPLYLARAVAVLAGIAIPIAISRIVGPFRALTGTTLVGAVLISVVLVRLHGRVPGWRVALGALALFALFSIAR
jgi:PTS system mannose-specific IID component